ncbi:hypothetical protein EAG_00455, partial [Camponotus floridanus]
VNKLRTLLFKIKYSENLSIKFRRFCEIVNLKYNVPVMDVKTRWNSTAEMLAYSLRLKPALEMFCDNIENLKSLKLLEEEWLLIKKAYSFLHDFQEFSTTLGGEKYVTLPKVVIGFNLLIDKIE